MGRLFLGLNFAAAAEKGEAAPEVVAKLFESVRRVDTGGLQGRAAAAPMKMMRESQRA